MIPSSDKLSDYLYYFFTCYLPQHRNVSPHTVAGYKQTFIQLLRYCKLRFPAQPDPGIDQFQIAFLLDFLTHLEKDIGTAPSTQTTLTGLAEVPDGDLDGTGTANLWLNQGQGALPVKRT